MEDQNIQQASGRKSTAWIWVVVVLIIIIAGGVIAYFLLRGNSASKSTTTTSKTTDVTAQKWVRDPTESVDKGVTSTDTHKISDSAVRTYFMKDGEIQYAESTDGAKIYAAAQSTGINQEKGSFISNPVVLEISSGKWIMIYEQKPEPKPGQEQGKTPPGPDTQRDLYLATSTDGKTFQKVDRVIDSAKEDNYFASVPDLVKLPDGKIRMYYVSGGEAIGSATSSDDGKSWVRDSGYRLQNSAVDPDVVYKDGKWLMYYSNLDPQKNALYLSTSSDGIKWQEGVKILDRAGSSGSIVDPDVFEFGGKNIMLFGEFLGGDSATTQESPDLYRAVEQNN